MASYLITQTVPTVYLDRRNIAVNGFLVYVELPEFSEIHEIRVPSMDLNVVRQAAEALLAQRRAIAKLGSEPGK